jgi:hypothetical protein
MAIGRISGQLLKSNLLRAGENLAFETDLLYLDVVNSRVGIKTTTPTNTLQVNGSTRTTNLTLDNQLIVGDLTFTGNTIISSSATIIFSAAAGEPTVYHSRLQIDDLQIQNNTISTTVSNSNIEIEPNGTGTVNLVANTNITGNLNVSGDISAVGNVTIGGNIVIGDAITDTITINASIQSDLIPTTDNTFDLGSSGLRWRSAYVNNFFTTTLNVPALNIGDVSITDNEITTAPGENLILDGNGTGGVRLGNFLITDNVITNVASNQITQIAQSGTGYFKIAGTNGFVPPRGTNAQRPTAYAALGMTRYNTESQALEIWNGSVWASPAGLTGSISTLQAEDIAVTWAITLG